MANDGNDQSSLRFIDFSALTDRLELEIGAAATLIGITVRQLGYWADKGFIPYKRVRSSRVYDFTAIKKASLIKQGLDNGHGLDRAVKLAESLLERQTKEQQTLETLTNDELRRLVTARAFRLGQLADLMRGRDIRDYEIKEGTIAPEEIRSVAKFLEVNPYTTYTASKIGTKIGQAIDRVTTVLDLLTTRHFIQKLKYPAGDVYRYIPRRHTSDYSGAR